MGTAPGNFPPGVPLEVGNAYNKTGLTAALTTTVFFTAPVSGIYLVGWLAMIVSTDGAGSITVTVTPPHSVAIPGVNPAPATPSDGKGPAVPIWMNASDTVTVAAAVSGLTGTTYNLYLTVLRMFG